MDTTSRRLLQTLFTDPLVSIINSTFSCKNTLNSWFIILNDTCLSELNSTSEVQRPWKHGLYPSWTSKAVKYPLPQVTTRTHLNLDFYS